MSKKIVAYCCDNSSYQAADMCGYLRLAHPPGVMTIQVPCIGSIQPADILGAFENGAAGVLLLGCYDDSCRHIWGNSRAKGRLRDVRQILSYCGLPEDAVEFYPVSAGEAKKCAKVLEEFAERLDRSQS